MKHLRHEYYLATCLIVILNELLNKIDYIDTNLTTDEKVINEIIQAYCNKLSYILILFIIIQNINSDSISFLSAFFHVIIFYVAILLNIIVLVVNTKKYFESRIKL